MRYLERQILLQIIDNRWREHLYEMDYLREGIHLRGFAQIDPLVAYKNEGFTMFQELMASIWEEFVRVIFHVEVNIEPAQAEQMFGEEARRGGDVQYSGSAGEERPSAMRDGAGRQRRDRRRQRRRGDRRRRATGSGGDQPGDGRQGRRTRRSAATIPAGAVRARSTRSATAPSAITVFAENLAAAERLLAALRERDRDGIAAELHPEVVARGDKGSFSGVDAVVGWAKPSDDGHLVSRVEVDEVREVGDDHVAVDARRQWRWKETDQLADESRFGVLLEFRDGRVYRWRQNFASIIEAIDAI